MTTRYVALLRGINVGGRTRVAMDDLRRLFADLGHGDVTTYIQSGNVLFDADGPADGAAAPVAAAIEEGIAAELGLSVTVVLRSATELDAVVDANPFAGRVPDPSKLHVTFLAAEPAGTVEAPPGVADELALVGREVYLHCPGGYGRTKLDNGFFERRLGVPATTRTWTTVRKLRDLLTTPS